MLLRTRNFKLELKTFYCSITCSISAICCTKNLSRWNITRTCSDFLGVKLRKTLSEKDVLRTRSRNDLCNNKHFHLSNSKEKRKWRRNEGSNLSQVSMPIRKVKANWINTNKSREPLVRTWRKVSQVRGGHWEAERLPAVSSKNGT